MNDTRDLEVLVQRAADPEVLARLDRIEKLLEAIAHETALPRLAKERFDAAAAEIQGAEKERAALAEKDAELELTRLRCRLPKLWKDDRDVPPSK